MSKNPNQKKNRKYWKNQKVRDDITKIMDALDKALGYTDTEPKTPKEFKEDHIESERHG